MSQLSPQIVEDVVAACRAGAEEAAGALSRTLDSTVELAVGGPLAWSANGYSSSGLVLQFVVEGTAAALLLPDSTGLVPVWCQAPDATGESKLSTLAQELSMLLLPEVLMADEFRATWVGDMAAELAAGELSADAAAVSLTLAAGEQTHEVPLVWPLANPAAMFAVKEGGVESELDDDASDVEQANDSQHESAAAQDGQAPDPYHLPYRPSDYSELPPYARHLLKVTVPVSVHLVSKKQTVRQITHLVPGSIINFDKACDAPLEMYVNNRLTALGETVKVGERFGLQISEIVLPPENFSVVKKRAAGA
jgi:flagellar motor switch/type III secretory pathway protein FliN